MGVRLHVLGSCGAWPEAGRACSGFVLDYHGFRTVLDLGYGTASPLFALVGSSVGDGIDAVVVTHAHPDHMVDLHALFRARWFGRRDAAPIPLYAPRQVVDRLTGLEEDDASAAVGTVFDWYDLPADQYQVGPLTLTSFALPHFVLNAGVRLSAPDLALAYTGDTGPSPVLAELGGHADLFIVEASDRHQQPGVAGSPDGSDNHLTAEGAAKAAAAAGARRLMLTHFWPGNDREQSHRVAAEHFGGDLILADEGLEVPLV